MSISVVVIRPIFVNSELWPLHNTLHQPRSCIDLYWYLVPASPRMHLLLSHNINHFIHYLPIQYYAVSVTEIMPWSYFSVATTSRLHLRNNNADDVRINCCRKWVEPRTRCDVVIPTFRIPDNNKQQCTALGHHNAVQLTHSVHQSQRHIITVHTTAVQPSNY